MLSVNEFLLRQAAKPSGQVNKEICIDEIKQKGKTAVKTVLPFLRIVRIVIGCLRWSGGTLPLRHGLLSEGYRTSRLTSKRGCACRRRAT